MKIKKQAAFTLVELIVVITILAILWTIAFISLQWYSQSSRDSVRISDMSSMKNTLEYFFIDNWKYPQPTDWVNITYSWAIVWNQWIFWDTVFWNISKLDKIPLDPSTDNFYTYSVTSTRNKYQLWWVLEWDPVALNNLELANAETKVEWTAIIAWTYNWQAVKTLSGASLCNMIITPTIIWNDLVETNFVNLTNSWKLVYNWYKNLPWSYKSSKFKLDWWFNFKPNKFIAYSDNSGCSSLLGSDPTARIQMLKWIQEWYSWTLLKEIPSIAQILNLAINESSPSEEVKNLAWAYVNNNL